MATSRYEDTLRGRLGLNITNEPPRTSISRTPYASDLSDSLDQPLDLSNPHDHQTSLAALHISKFENYAASMRFSPEITHKSSRIPHASDLSNSLYPSYPCNSRTSSAVSPSFSSQFADPAAFSRFAPPSSISTHSPPLQLSSLSLNPVTHIDHVSPEMILSSISNGSSPTDEDDESSLENTDSGRAPKGSVRGRLGSTGRGRARKKEVPSDSRDKNYYEKRQRNNRAAQKSREKKKREEILTKLSLAREREKNEKLRAEIVELRQLVVFLQVRNASSTLLNNGCSISP